MTKATLTEALLSLPVTERVSLADKLYASVPADWQAHNDLDWQKEAESRSAEMDDDSTMNLSREEFISGVRPGSKSL